MSAAHTPGPWQLNEIDGTGQVSKHYIFIEPGVAVIERKVDGHNDCDLPDALLIAAAPDLLEALNFLVGCSAPMTGQQEQCWISIRAAIAKATVGNQS